MNIAFWCITLVVSGIFYKNNQMTGEFCQQKISIVLKKKCALLNLIVIVYSNDFLHLVFLNEIPFLHVLMIVRPCHFLEREVLWGVIFLNIITLVKSVENMTLTGHVCNGTDMDRTFSVPMSVLHLLVDKGQGLQSRILSSTSLVLPSNDCWDESLNV